MSLMAAYTVKFTNSAGFTERRDVGRSEALALLDRLEKLGATAVSVLAPNGDHWSRLETIRRLGEV